MLVRGQLSSVVGSIFTNTTTAKIKTIVFFNSGLVTNTVSVHIVPSNAGSVGTAGIANQILSIALTSGTTFEFSPSYPINFDAVNDSIQASATNGNQVNYFVMGV